MDHANETPDILRRKTPAWLVSIGIHAGLLLLLGAFWVVQQLEEEKVVIVSTASIRPEVVFPPHIETRADVHDPIVPKVFQPDPVIINDAFRVVENTIPENKQGPRYQGGSPDRVSDRSFMSNCVTDVTGAGGGAGGRYGFPSRPAGFG